MMSSPPARYDGKSSLAVIFLLEVTEEKPFRDVCFMHFGVMLCALPLRIFVDVLVCFANSISNPFATGIACLSCNVRNCSIYPSTGCQLNR